MTASANKNEPIVAAGGATGAAGDHPVPDPPLPGRRPRRLTVDRSLVIFLLLGLAVFAVERWTRGVDPASARIDVGDAEIGRLAELWSAQMRRAPSATELDALIRDHVREEILYREALRLGLDRDDVIVRRRLAQKMGFLLEDRAAPEVPAENDMRAYYEEHVEKYVEEASTTFVHVFFSPSRGDEGETATVRAALRRLQDQHPGGEWRALGDPFMLRREYAELSRAEAVELFGPAFASSLDDLPVKTWAGPVTSAYGQHLVYVASRAPRRRRDFAEVRKQVREDWLELRRREENARAFDDVRRRYRVLVRGEALGPAAAPGGEP